MYENINPYIRRVWYHTMQPEEAIARRVIFDYELIYIKRGKATIVIEDIPYITQPGDLFIIRLSRNTASHRFPAKPWFSLIFTSIWNILQMQQKFRFPTILWKISRILPCIILEKIF